MVKCGGCRQFVVSTLRPLKAGWKLEIAEFISYELCYCRMQMKNELSKLIGKCPNRPQDYCFRTKQDKRPNTISIGYWDAVRLLIRMFKFILFLLCMIIVDRAITIDEVLLSHSLFIRTLLRTTPTIVCNLQWDW